MINCGVAGYNSWESLINLEFRVLDLEPDLIIVYHGTNDVHARLAEPSCYRGDNSGRRKQWGGPLIVAWKHLSCLRVLLRGIGYCCNNIKLKDQIYLEHLVCKSDTMHHIYSTQPKHEIGEILKSNPPIYFQRNLRNIIAIAKEHEIDVLFATWAYSPYFNDYASNLYYIQGFEENNRVVREVAATHDIYLLDFATIMPQEKKYWFDGRHVNEAGAKKKAELFAEFIHNNKLITK